MEMSAVTTQIMQFMADGTGQVATNGISELSCLNNTAEKLTYRHGLEMATDQRRDRCNGAGVSTRLVFPIPS